MGISVNIAYIFAFLSILILVGGGIEVMHARVEVQEARDDHYALAGDKLRTNLTIVSSNTTGSGPYTLNVWVENTGSTPLNPADLTVLVDGVEHDYTTVGGVWSPMETITITVEDLQVSPSRAVVAAPNGVIASADV